MGQAAVRSAAASSMTRSTRVAAEAEPAPSSSPSRAIRGRRDFMTGGYLRGEECGRIGRRAKPPSGSHGGLAGCQGDALLRRSLLLGLDRDLAGHAVVMDADV